MARCGGESAVADDLLGGGVGGHAKQALAKYDQSLKYAPNWKQLEDTKAALNKAVH
jgi:hypothetical protein